MSRPECSAGKQELMKKIAVQLSEMRAGGEADKDDAEVVQVDKDDGEVVVVQDDDAEMTTNKCTGLLHNY